MPVTWKLPWPPSSQDQEKNTYDQNVLKVARSTFIVASQSEFGQAYLSTAQAIHESLPPGRIAWKVMGSGMN